MNQKFGSFVLTLLFISFAKAAPTCNSADVMSRVYHSVGKFLCLDKFYNGASRTEKSSDNIDCSSMYVGLAVAPAATGYAASKVAAIADNRAHNTRRRQLADAATDASRKAQYWNRFTRADSPSFKPFSDYSRAEYQKYMAALTKAEDLNFLAGTIRPANTYSRKVAQIASKKVVLYGAATLTGFGVLLTAADVASAVFSPTQAACSTLDYMYIDTSDGCTYVPAIGPNTSRFLSMSPEEQEKIMKDYPSVCESYSQLAQKLESDLEKTFPTPEFQITSCGKNNEVTGVELKYPNGGGLYNVNLNGTTLSVKTGASDRINYDLVLQDKGFGVESVSTLRSTVKDSKLARVHIPSDVLSSADSHLRSAHRELGASLRALEGFTMVKTSTGNKCRDYLEQQSEEADATAPTNR